MEVRPVSIMRKRSPKQTVEEIACAIAADAPYGERLIPVRYDDLAVMMSIVAARAAMLPLGHPLRPLIEGALSRGIRARVENGGPVHEQKARLEHAETVKAMVGAKFGLA